MPLNPMLSPDSLPIVPSIAWLGCGVLFFLASIVVVSVLKKMSPKESTRSVLAQSTLFMWRAFKLPFLFFLFGYLVFVVGTASVVYLSKVTSPYEDLILNSVTYIKKITEFLTFFWLILNLLNDGQLHLERWLLKHNKTVPMILLAMINKSFKAAITLLMVSILIPALGFTGQIDEALTKGVRVALILILAWLFVQLLNGMEKLILNQYMKAENTSLYSRTINTQVLLLKKVILIIAGVVTIASILMVFDSVKHLGAGLLTTAGVLSAMGAFASQQSLSRIFAGLQIAFSQTIRLGDTVVIDKEQGVVEEISLSYIVVKLWDLRRLIVPSDYFSNHELRNLSRSSTELLGTIYFYTDYMLPLAPVREKFNEILRESSLWNGEVSNFQVTDIKESSMELRALVSAQDSGTLWDLRCEVREKLMQFIIENYPEYLPKTRNVNAQAQFEHAEEK
jgi:small-conductance mechanosensitive channel